MLDWKLIVKAFLYVQSGSSFWAAMGITTAVAMFIGAMIYDGEMNQAKKGLLSVGAYAMILFWMIYSRVSDVFESGQITLSNHPENSIAGLISILMVTFAWILGIMMGVWIFNRRYHGGHRP